MQNFEFFHGAAIIRIIRSNHFKIIETFSRSNSAYIINEKIGVFIKYSQKRMAPWVFTFDKDHVIEIKEIFELLENVFIVLVCNNDGICCINWKEFCTLISTDSNNYPKWIKVTRRKNEKYSIFSIDGKLKHKVGNSDFPDKLDKPEVNPNSD